MTHHGLWLRKRVVQELTRGVVDARVARGEWQSPLPGVLAEGGYELSAEQWAEAVVLASGGADQPVPFGEPREDGSRRLRMKAVACGRDAARVHGFPLIDDDDPATGVQERFQHDVHVFGRNLGTISGPPPPHDPDADPDPDHPIAHTLQRHRLSLLPSEFGRMPSGLWVTRHLCTALHCVQLLTQEAAVCVLDHGLHHALFSASDLADPVAARRGKPGGRKLANAVSLADGRAESPNETLARLLLLPHLPALEPQVEIRTQGRVVARLDLGDREVRLAVELDGRRGHAGDAMMAKDDRRNRRTRELGWVTERGVWYDVRRRQEEFIRRVVARHRSRRTATWPSPRSRRTGGLAANPGEAPRALSLVLAQQPTRRRVGC